MLHSKYLDYVLLSFTYFPSSFSFSQFWRGISSGMLAQVWLGWKRFQWRFAGHSIWWLQDEYLQARHRPIHHKTWHWPTWIGRGGQSTQKFSAVLWICLWVKWRWKHIFNDAPRPYKDIFFRSSNNIPTWSVEIEGRWKTTSEYLWWFSQHCGKKDCSNCSSEIFLTLEPGVQSKRYGWHPA